MFLRSLVVPIKSIKGIRTSDISALARLGINSVSDLLLHYPRDWEDRSRIVPISNYRSERVCTIVTVLTRKWIGFGKKRTLKVYVQDETAQAVLLCFNRPWLEKQLVTGEQFRLWGSFSYKYGEIQSGAFEIEPAEKTGSFSRILPVYPLTSGISQVKLRNLTFYVLGLYAKTIVNELPQEIIERDNLLPKNTAIRAVHFPDSTEELERAKKTLIYEELFYLEILVVKRALARKNKTTELHRGKEKENIKTLYNSKANEVCQSSVVINFENGVLQQRLIERLPFSLTPGQKNAVAEINFDMSADGNPSMARLLQGDVGSGKTLVSFLAALGAVEKKGQAAIMAPTELLARQHAENAAKLLEPLGVNIAFLTGNIKAAGRKELIKNLTAGIIDIVVGTHALFSGDVTYKNLRLVVIDEQHRFGVTQRSAIMSKGENPDLLMMSATPIPRTLAFTIFGDMDVSVIKDKPPGRKPVITHLAKESNEMKVYDFIRRELEAGRQVYFVYPLIEGTDGQTDELKDAVSMMDRLKTEVFPQFKIALIHSKLPDDEKKKTMDDFRMGDIKILVATSVVEVGVDVPNATCMVIEHAERFGLSALHQLRGRVGRGQEQSYCFLVYSDELTEDGKIRMKVMLENNDGFIIAEEDLKLRGPGQIAGTEQSGYLFLGLANPVRDIKELERARNDAFSILENDPDLLLKDHNIISKVLEEAPPFPDVVL